MILSSGVHNNFIQGVHCTDLATTVSMKDKNAKFIRSYLFKCVDSKYLNHFKHFVIIKSLHYFYCLINILPNIFVLHNKDKKLLRQKIKEINEQTI